MIRFLELIVFRTVLWVGVPLLLAVLIVGPRRVQRWLRGAWDYFFRKRLDPEEILTDVVRQHEGHVASLRDAVKQTELALSSIADNLARSRQNIAELEAQSRNLAEQGDELGARAALYKLNLEQTAVASFEQQHERQVALIDEARRRLYLLELQLRQFEVGRSILLSQLAQAKNVEHQYAIANQFDPFNAIAEWKRAEGIVEEKALTAHAIQRVHNDTAQPLSIAGQPVEVDPVVLENQLQELRRQMQQATGQTADAPPDSEPPRRPPLTQQH